MPYISNTDFERDKMLSEIGVRNFDELLINIPKKFRPANLEKLEKAHSELEITAKISELAEKNTTNANSFLGGGIYDHFIPAAVDHIALRPEFHSAYTPYQAEVSQGTLQYIYEYQTMICELTGMDISNAGMYDGASACAEAILMTTRKTKKYRAIIAGSVNPAYLEVIRSYTEGVGIELEIIPQNNGQIDLKKLEEKIDDETGCVLLQTPNFFGNIEDAFTIEKIAHSVKKALFIVAVDPISLAILNSPAEYNADIVVGEGQALGNAMNFGGPLLGFLATREKLAKRSYTLTLQAREQHIRRAKATSNICSNQALCNLNATVYMCLLGKQGLKEVAIQSTTKAHYLAEEISKLNGFSLAFPTPFFKEFVINTPFKNDEISKLEKKNIFPGIDLKRFGMENNLLIAVTEKKRKCDLDNFTKALREVANG